MSSYTVHWTQGMDQTRETCTFNDFDQALTWAKVELADNGQVWPNVERDDLAATYEAGVFDAYHNRMAIITAVR